MKEFFIPIAILLAGSAAAAIIYLHPGSAANAAFLPLPFEGRITNVEYNCLCSGAIMLTIEPTVPGRYGQQPQQFLLVWAAQVLDRIADKFGIKPNIPIIIPTTYLWCQVFYAGNQTLLGNYIAGSFPCAAYTGNGCAIRGYAQGAILNVGTSAF